MRGAQVKRVRCEASGVLVAKDKAIKRFIVRNIVDASAIRDIQDSSILEGEAFAVSISRPAAEKLAVHPARLMLPCCWHLSYLSAHAAGHDSSRVSALQCT